MKPRFFRRDLRRSGLPALRNRPAMLSFLLAMMRMDAEQRIRFRSKRNLS
jgi:hypothetical protein